MPNIAVLSEFDDDNLTTKLELSIDGTTLSTYTYTQSTNEVTVSPRASSTEIPVSVFSNGISETGTWSSRSVSRLLPTRGTVDEYQLSIETPTSDTIAYGYTCRSVSMSGTYTISTDTVTIGSHAGVTLPWENFSQVIALFSFVTDLISKTKVIAVV